MKIKYEQRPGSTQCGSMMSLNGQGWTCCTLVAGHAGTAHYSDHGWQAEWDERWTDPVYHNRCSSVDSRGDRCAKPPHGGIAQHYNDSGRNSWIDSGHAGYAYAYSTRAEYVNIQFSIPKPQVRTYAERKAHRRRIRS